MKYDPFEAAKKLKNYQAYTDPKKVIEHNYLPEPTGERVPYMVSLSSSCPRNELSLLGITFTRAQFTPRTSTEDVPKPVAFFVELSQNQKEALDIIALKKVVVYRDENNERVETPYSEFIQVTEYPFGIYDNIEPMEDVTSKALNMDQLRSVEDQKKYIAWMEKHLEECKRKAKLFEELKENSQQFEPDLKGQKSKTKKRTG